MTGLKRTSCYLLVKKTRSFLWRLRLPQFIERLANYHNVVADVPHYCCIYLWHSVVLCGGYRFNSGRRLTAPIWSNASFGILVETLRYSLKINAWFITRKILCLHRNSLISKYTELRLVFCISGLTHALTDIHANIHLDDSGSIQFFMLNAAVIMI